MLKFTMFRQAVNWSVTSNNLCMFRTNLYVHYAYISNISIHMQSSKQNLYPSVVIWQFILMLKLFKQMLEVFHFKFNIAN